MAVSKDGMKRMMSKAAKEKSKPSKVVSSLDENKKRMSPKKKKKY